MKHIKTFESFLNESKGQYKIDDYSLKVLSKYFKKNEVTVIWDELCNTAKELGSKLIINNITQVLDEHGAKNVSMVDEMHLLQAVKELV
jgi:hypothetical protein